MLGDTILDPAEIEFFDRNGYLIVRNALAPDTITEIVDVADRLLSSDDQMHRQTMKSGRYDSFRNCVSKHPVFQQLIDHPVILPTVVQLLGADLHMVTSHLIYKDPEPTGTPPTFREPGWHRDYFQAMQDMGHHRIQRLLVKCAYYFTDLREPNSGVTMVVPGSHQLREPIAIPEGAADPEGALQPSLQAGDCLIFENRTYHAGAANLVSHTRKACMIGYGYRWLKPMDYRVQSAQLLEQLNPLQRFICGEPYAQRDTFAFDGGENPITAWCEERGLPTVRY